MINRCEAEHKAFQAHGIFFDNKVTSLILKYFLCGAMLEAFSGMPCCFELSFPLPAEECLILQVGLLIPQYFLLAIGKENVFHFSYCNFKGI